jgi:5-enolpyruvylshikimate-3-phosphate synthase
MKRSNSDLRIADGRICSSALVPSDKSITHRTIVLTLSPDSNPVETLSDEDAPSVVESKPAIR